MSHDPRFSRADVRGNPQLELVSRVLDSARAKPGPGVTSNSGFSGVTLSTRPPRTASVARPFFHIADDSTRNDAGVITAARVKLVTSLLAKDVPTTGLTALAVATGNTIYAHVAFNSTTGAVTARTIEAAASVPAPSLGHAYLAIGIVTITGPDLVAVNYVHGPITGCLNWFSQPLTYTLEGSP